MKPQVRLIVAEFFAFYSESNQYKILNEPRAKFVSLIPEMYNSFYSNCFMISEIVDEIWKLHHNYKITPMSRKARNSLKLQLHNAIYWLRFYSNSFIHILSFSNSHSNVASIQNNRGDKSHPVIGA